MANNDGGSAFSAPAQMPTTQFDGFTTTQTYFIPAKSGMSLRDWLAGMALQGLVSNRSTTHYTKQEFAIESYKISDAMIEERSKDGN